MSNQENIITALKKKGATVKVDGIHIEATFMDPRISIGFIETEPGKKIRTDIVIYYFHNLSLNPADYGYKIFGNTGDIGNSKRIVILSPDDFQ